MKDKVQALIDKYAEALAAKGIQIKVKKRFVADKVMERFHSTSGSAVFNEIERMHDRKAERENGYNYEDNKYYLITLTVSPIEHLIKKEECKEYAFTVRKVERAHIGMKPREVEYKEEKILKKIEKRICRILSLAEKKTALQICRDNLFDAFRYTMHPRYKYKNQILGKDYFFWDMVFCIVPGITVIVIVLMAWLISSLV